MKFILFALSLFWSISTFSQTYNTNIDKAQKVEIKNGVINIKKADTVFIKIYPAEKLKTKLILSFYEEIIDTLGGYTINLLINNPNESEYHDVDIKLKFDKPIESIQWFTGLQYGTKDESVGDKLAPRLRFRKCECDEGIKVVIKSKVKVVCSVYGVSDKL